jgi:hypothetical protein
MAKRKNAAAQPKEVPAAQMKRIDNLRRPFMAFATAFGPIAQKRAEFAPAFMREYTAWRETIGRGAASSFVNFVRLFDKTVPQHAGDGKAGDGGYKSNKVYQAADYLRRAIVVRSDNARRGATLTATQQLARTVATVLTTGLDAQTVWNAVEKELGITGRRLENLRKLTGTIKPVLNLTGAGKVRAAVVHMSQAEIVKLRRVEEPETAAGARKGARRMRIAA